MRRFLALASGASALVALFCCNDPYDSANAPANPPDATIDDGGGTHDASTRDVASEAARDPDAGCAHFRDAEFCDDFDQPSSLTPTTWTTIDPGATLATDDTVSAPSAARFLLRDAGACGYLHAQRVFPGERYIVTTRMAMHATTPGTFLVLESGPASSTGYCSLSVGLEDETTVSLTRESLLSDGGSAPAGVATIELATSALIRFIDVEVEFNIITRYATLRVEGQSVELPLPTDFSLVGSRVSVGPSCVADTDLRVDDFVVFTRLP